MTERLFLRHMRPNVDELVFIQCCREPQSVRISARVWCVTHGEVKRMQGDERIVL